MSTRKVHAKFTSNLANYCDNRLLFCLLLSTKKLVINLKNKNFSTNFSFKYVLQPIGVHYIKVVTLCRTYHLQENLSRYVRGKYNKENRTLTAVENRALHADQFCVYIYKFLAEIMASFNVTENQCVSDDEIFSETDFFGNWNYLPDAVLLQIFQYLSPRELMNAGLTCKTWLRVSFDDFLWKDIVYSHFQIDRSIKILPGKYLWREEYKRLTYHIPVIETEVLEIHTHQVLYVSFSHNGKLFATCSKDGLVLVWDSGYPAEVKYCRDMRDFAWKCTQFCQFNQSDTLLLVSGVHFGMPHNTSGEIAVFSLQDGFNLQCRVINKPYDIFGTWYNDNYLVSGSLYPVGRLINASVLWLNKASQETKSEHVPIIKQLCKFGNFTGNYIRTVIMANCLSPNKEANSNDRKDAEKILGELNICESVPEINIKLPSPNDSRSEIGDLCKYQSSSLQDAFNWGSLGEGLEYASPIYYNQHYREVETEHQLNNLDSLDDKMSEDLSNQCDDSNSIELNSDASDFENDCSETEDSSEINVEKLLIFTTGFKTCAPHQIGFKRIKPVTFPKRLNPGPTLAERIAEKQRKNSESQLPNSEPLAVDEVLFDMPDDLIDLNGHITGLGLSPDHRYLYVNNRPWPQGYVIDNPTEPPPIAQEIDIHVIDLVTLKEVGTMLRAHKAYTPSSECFFIFLNVSNEYVASGAEDKHGYLWDRHYGICLAKYPHKDVVNSVAFNPTDPEMLVTTSDDHTIKIWRSKNRVKQLKIENQDSLPRGLEIRLKPKKTKRL